MSTIPLPDRSAPPRLTDYAAERESFQLPVPERFNSVISIIEGRAKDAPDDLALVST